MAGIASTSERYRTRASRRSRSIVRASVTSTTSPWISLGRPSASRDSTCACVRTHRTLPSRWKTRYSMSKPSVSAIAATTA